MAQFNFLYSQTSSLYRNTATVNIIVSRLNLKLYNRSKNSLKILKQILFIWPRIKLLIKLAVDNRYLTNCSKQKTKLSYLS